MHQSLLSQLEMYRCVSASIHWFFTYRIFFIYSMCVAVWESQSDVAAGEVGSAKLGLEQNWVSLPMDITILKDSSNNNNDIYFTEMTCKCVFLSLTLPRLS